MVDDLQDTTNSGHEMSLAAMLKWAGFGHLDTGLLLCACPYTKTNQTEWSGNGRLRNVARAVLRSNGPKRTAALDEITWSEPLDFLAVQDMPAPELQERHIPAALWGFVIDEAERKGVDATAIAVIALAVCSGVISNDWRVQLRALDTTFLVRALLWAAIVGDPSVLKSPIIRACCAHLNHLEATARERYRQEMRVYETACRVWKKAVKSDPEMQPPRRPKQPHFTIEDATMESVQEVLRDDDEATQCAPCKKVLARFDELSGLFANLDRYVQGGKGGGDRAHWLSLYEGDSHKLDRVGRGHHYVPHWASAMVGGIQPEPLQRLASQGDEDGMFPRFTFVVPGPPCHGTDEAPDYQAKARYDAVIERLIVLRPGRNVAGQLSHMVLHADGHAARQRIEDLARALIYLPDITPRLKAGFGKWPGLFGRLTLTFHLINHVGQVGAEFTEGSPPEVIPAKTLEMVAAFMEDIILPHALRADAVMNRTQQSSAARDIAGLILSKGAGATRITLRDIQQQQKPLRAPERRKDLQEVMASLVNAGWLEPEDPGSNGLKPVHSWLINPALYALFADRAAAEVEARKRRQEDAAMAFKAIQKLRGK